MDNNTFYITALGLLKATYHCNDTESPLIINEAVDYFITDLNKNDENIIKIYKIISEEVENLSHLFDKCINDDEISYYSFCIKNDCNYIKIINTTYDFIKLTNGIRNLIVIVNYNKHIYVATNNEEVYAADKFDINVFKTSFEAPVKYFNAYNFIKNLEYNISRFEIVNRKCYIGDFSYQTIVEDDCVVAIKYECSFLDSIKKFDYSRIKEIEFITVDSLNKIGGTLIKNSEFNYKVLINEFKIEFYTDRDFFVIPNGKLSDIEIGNVVNTNIISDRFTDSFFLMFPNLEFIVGIENIDTYNINTLFRFLPNIRSLDFSDVYTSAVTSMNGMFEGCERLEELDLSNFDTSNVENMDSMFDGCSSLKVLDLSSFYTQNVTSVGSMFAHCKSLEKLDLSKFDTINVENMSSMFFYCISLKELDLSNFETKNVTNMAFMFAGCNSLKELDLSNFNTSNVGDMDSMFDGCSSLKVLDLSNFDTNNVTDMRKMFAECKSLEELYLSNFNTNNVENMCGMFFYCNSLKELDLSNFDTSNVEDMFTMFDGCSSLQELDLSKFDTSSVINMGCMFDGCTNLKKLNLSNIDTSNVENMFSMFAGCSSLMELDLSSFDTHKVWRMSLMFGDCKSLQKLNINNFSYSSITNMTLCFLNCNKIDKLDLKNLDIDTKKLVFETYIQEIDDEFYADSMKMDFSTEKGMLFYLFGKTEITTNVMLHEKFYKISIDKNMNNQYISVADELLKLNNLLNSGIITKEEFDKMKSELINKGYKQ